MNILGERKKNLSDRSSNPAHTTLLGAVATGSLQIDSQWPPLMTNSKS